MRCAFHVCAPIVALFLLTFLPASGQQTTSEAARLDVVILVKNSTSMRSSDPSFLARDLVLDLSARLAPGSRLGMVVFDQRAELTVPLVDTATVASIEQIAAGLDAISYAGRHSDLSVGLERTLEELESNGRPGVGRGIVLITDGRTDDDGPRGAPEKEPSRLQVVAKDCAEGDIPVFAIAVAAGRHSSRLRELVDLTGGELFDLDDASRSGVILAHIASTLAQPTTGRQIAPTASIEPVEQEITSETRGTLRTFVIPALAVALGVGIVVMAWNRRRGTRSRRGPGPIEAPRPSPTPVSGASLKDAAGVVLKEPFMLPEAATRVGREPANDLVIAESTVSGEHARIEYGGCSFSILDVGSSNGTFLNGERLPAHEPRRLADGDRITIDVYEFVFQQGDEQARESSVPDEAAVVVPPCNASDAPESPAPEAGRAADAAAPNASGADTRLKPATCPVHPEERATELCAACKEAFCARCVVEQDGMTVCRSCVDVPSSI